VANSRTCAASIVRMHPNVCENPCRVEAVIRSEQRFPLDKSQYEPVRSGSFYLAWHYLLCKSQLVSLIAKTLRPNLGQRLGDECVGSRHAPWRRT
jgi:hypothetical protein